MKSALSLLPVLLLIIGYGCGVKYTPTNLPEKQLIFGEGGGVAGGVDESVLLENGQMFSRKNFKDVTTEHPRIKKDEAAAFFTRFENDLIDLKYIRPGNHFYYIQYQADSASNYRIVWADNVNDVPEAAMNLFKDLRLAVKPPKEKKK